MFGCGLAGESAIKRVCGLASESVDAGWASGLVS